MTNINEYVLHEMCHSNSTYLAAAPSVNKSGGYGNEFVIKWHRTYTSTQHTLEWGREKKKN